MKQKTLRTLILAIGCMSFLFPSAAYATESTEPAESTEQVAEETEASSENSEKTVSTEKQEETETAEDAASVLQALEDYDLDEEIFEPLDLGDDLGYDDEEYVMPEPAQDSGPWMEYDEENKMLVKTFMTSDSVVRIGMYAKKGYFDDERRITIVVGGDIFSAGKDGVKTAQARNGNSLEYAGAIDIEKYNMDCHVYYAKIAETASQPVEWEWHMPIDRALPEVFIVKQDIPEGWETVKGIKWEKPVEMLACFINSATSGYTDQDIRFIVNEVSDVMSAGADGSNFIPIDDNKEINYKMLIIIGCIAGFVIFVLLYIRGKKNKKLKEETERDAFVKKANEKMAKKKASENRALKEMAAKYGEEYDDDRRRPPERHAERPDRKPPADRRPNKPDQRREPRRTDPREQRSQEDMRRDSRRPPAQQQDRARRDDIRDERPERRRDDPQRQEYQDIGSRSRAMAYEERDRYERPGYDDLPQRNVRREERDEYPEHRDGYERREDHYEDPRDLYADEARRGNYQRQQPPARQESVRQVPPLSMDYQPGYENIRQPYESGSYQDENTAGYANPGYPNDYQPGYQQAVPQEPAYRPRFAGQADGYTSQAYNEPPVNAEPKRVPKFAQNT